MGSPRRGPPRDRDEKPWGRDRFDDDRRGPPSRDPPHRDGADSWRRGGAAPPASDSWRKDGDRDPPKREPPRGKDEPPKPREGDRKGGDDGWATVVKRCSCSMLPS